MAERRWPHHFWHEVFSDITPPLPVSHYLTLSCSCAHLDTKELLHEGGWGEWGCSESAPCDVTFIQMQTLGLTSFCRRTILLIFRYYLLERVSLLVQNNKGDNQNICFSVRPQASHKARKKLCSKLYKLLCTTFI